MHITFDTTSDKVLFLSENKGDSIKLKTFPGFLKSGNYHYCPKVLPVAYNLYTRCIRAFKTVTASPEFLAWVNSPFKLEPLPTDFKYHTAPKEFQDIALRYTYTLGSAGILLDPGMGKTKVVLDYVVLRKFSRSIIVCPVALLFVWEDEVAKHRPDLGVYVVRSTDWEKEWGLFLEAEKKAKEEGKVGMLFVINYDKVVTFQYRLIEVGFEYIHVDEFLIKNPSTSRSISITKIARTIPYRTGGSGTLINNSPLDSFSPIRYLNPALVGWNYGDFMETYCVMKDFKDQNGVARGKKPVAYKNQTEIKSILESCCVVMTKEKWLKLPDKHVHDIYVPMEEDQREAYYSLMKNFHYEMNGFDISIDNPLTMLSKLYQIAQGFIYYSPEDPTVDTFENQNVFDIMGVDKKVKAPGKSKKTSTRQTLYFKNSNKANKLKELLVSKLDGKKVLIWYNLSGELDLITKTLSEITDKYLVVKGGDKGIGDKIRSFNKDPSILYLVCQSKSVNYGITVMGSKAEDLEKEGVEVLPGIDTAVYNEVFFSMNFSAEVYSQQQDRIHRLGQSHDCHYWRIFSMCPVETKIRQAITDKLIIREEMLVDIAETVLSEAEAVEVT